MRRFTRVLLTFAMICTVFLQCGCSQSFDINSLLNLNGDYNQAMKAYNAKDYDKAIVGFNNALNSRPDDYTIYCYLGTSYMYKGDEKNAERVFQDAIRIFPDKWNVYTFMGDMKRTRHDFPAAIEYYQKAVSLASMPPESKPYYEKLIKEVKKEQFSWEAKGNMSIREKINPMNATPTYAVVLDLDPKIWEKAYEVSNDKNGLTEYGKKGEDVKDYKWTELVTVQYFALNETFQYSPSEYLASHIAPIETMAKDAHKSFVRKNLYQTNSEIIYEWSFDQGKESEVSRIIQTSNAIYHLHYAKKGAISDADKSKWVGVFKAAKIGN